MPTTMMSKYRVSYVDCCLREAVVEATCPEAAEQAVRLQMEDALHHHAVEDWNDAWHAEPYKWPPIVNRRCFECGELRS